MGLKIENFTDDGICIGRTMLGLLCAHTARALGHGGSGASVI